MYSLALLVIVLAVGGVAIFKPGPNDSPARSRANQVIQLFRIDRLTLPVDDRTLIALLGKNGGPVCASPNGAPTRALQDQQDANGAATVGSRPIRIDRDVVLGEDWSSRCTARRN